MEEFYQKIYDAISAEAERAEPGSTERFMGYAFSCFVLKLGSDETTEEMDKTVEDVASCVINEITTLTEVDALEFANQILDNASEVQDGE